MPFVVAFAFLTCFGLIAVLDQRWLARQGFRRKQEPPVVRRVHQWRDGALKVRCGARVQWWSASYPLATVTFDGEWLQVAGVPTYDVWVERTRVTGMRVFRAWPIGRCLMFASEDGAYDSTIVVLSRAQLRDVLEQLDHRSWPVATVLRTRS